MNIIHYQIVGGTGLHKLDHIHDLVEELYQEGIELFSKKSMAPVEPDSPSVSIMQSWTNYCKCHQMAEELYKELKNNKKYRLLYKVTMLRVLEQVPSSIFQKYPGYLGYIELPAERLHQGRSCVRKQPIREQRVKKDMLHCRYGWLRLDHSVTDLAFSRIALSRIEPGRWDAVILQ